MSEMSKITQMSGITQMSEMSEITKTSEIFHERNNVKKIFSFRQPNK